MKGKLWVLDTETKGTGAQMVPLEKVVKPPEPKQRLVPVMRHQPKPKPEPEPRPPRRFTVTDIASGEVLAEDAGVAATLELLGGLRSSVDVTVHVREDDRWRRLTLPERQLLWERRRPPGAA